MYSKPTADFTSHVDVDDEMALEFGESVIGFSGWTIIVKHGKISWP